MWLTSGAASQLEGVLEMSADVMGNSQQAFLGATFDIWKHEGDTHAPGTIEFALPLPATIRDVDGQMRPLPSSIKTPGISGVYAAVLYSVRVIVAVKGFGGVFKKNHRCVLVLEAGAPYVSTRMQSCHSHQVRTAKPSSPPASCN